MRRRPRRDNWNPPPVEAPLKRAYVPGPAIAIPTEQAAGVRAAIRRLVVDRRIFIITRGFDRESGKSVLVWLEWFPLNARETVGCSRRTGLLVTRMVDKRRFEPRPIPATWQQAIPAIVAAVKANLSQPSYRRNNEEAGIETRPEAAAGERVDA